ncbi:sugar phosphate nucleotidyltransferase [Halobacterium hubeiense]|uniref:sugar phosphate nucleotidyltransferase n=1 Tax=Halobacterium hubeiense TaxID=1407499 RepID=UPI003C780E95
MKAVILAAGEGKRLEPLTNRRPKPMLPVANRPVLEHVVEAVVDAGVDEVVLVVGYKRDRIQTHFGDGDDWGVDIEYAVQSKQLGTGHALLQAADHLDDSFVVLNGDRVISPDLVSSVIDRTTAGDAPVISVTRVKNARNYGVVELDGQRVTAIHEKPAAHRSQSDIINAGVYGFDPSVLDAVRETKTAPTGELALTATLDELAGDEGLTAVRYDDYWLDISYLWDVLSVNEVVVSRLVDNASSEPATGTGATVADDVAIDDDVRVGANATIHPRVSLGENVTVGPNAVVSNAVVLPDATVDAGAIVRDCIVGENATVGPNSTVVGGTARMVVEDEVHHDVRLGGVVGDNATLGGGVVVDSGTVVGDDATIQSGVTLDERVPPNAEVRRG